MTSQVKGANANESIPIAKKTPLFSFIILWVLGTVRANILYGNEHVNAVHDKNCSNAQTWWASPVYV